MSECHLQLTKALKPLTVDEKLEAVFRIGAASARSAQTEITQNDETHDVVVGLIEIWDIEINHAKISQFSRSAIDLCPKPNFYICDKRSFKLELAVRNVVQVGADT